MTKRKGFTIIEIVISVSVLLLLAAFSVPTYQLILSQLQLNSAVNQVNDFIRSAAQKTVTEQVIYGVQLTAGATTVPMYLNTNGALTQVSSTTLPTNMVINTVSLGGSNQIFFSPAGAPTVSGTFTIRDTIRNRSRTIQIRPSGIIRSNTVEQ